MSGRAEGGSASSSSLFRSSVRQSATSLASSTRTDSSYGSYSKDDSQDDVHQKSKRWRQSGGSIFGGVFWKKSGRGNGSGSGSIKSPVNDKLHTGDYGITDYREIPAWTFASQPFLEAEDKTRLSIGTLYVRVIEARNLMAADLSGRSDPYVKLCLSGRYLSHGQEWSEKLRIRARTRMIKYTLDPVWDEEFTLPVRRAGAVLKLEVWDWDRSSADDPLGHFEVNIGEELLSQKPIDMWYVLEAPAKMESNMAAAAAKAKAKAQAEAGKEGETEDSLMAQESIDSVRLDDDMAEDSMYGGDDSSQVPDSPGSTLETSSVAESDTAIYGSRGGRRSSRHATSSGSGSFGGSGKSIFGRRKSGSYSRADKGHESTPGALELRRKTFGEVRLELWFQFDPFAEACSHVWPEEPLKPENIRFSPNQLYRQMMLTWELFKPYVSAMKAANEIMCWVRPWHSFVWLIAIAVMLLYPYVLIVVFHCWLVRLVLASYWKHHCTKGSCLDHHHDRRRPQRRETIGVSTLSSSWHDMNDQNAASSSASPHRMISSIAIPFPCNGNGNGNGILDDDNSITPISGTTNTECGSAGEGGKVSKKGTWGAALAASRLSASVDRSSVSSPALSERRKCGMRKQHGSESPTKDSAHLDTSSSSRSKMSGRWGLRNNSRNKRAIVIGQRALSEPDVPADGVDQASPGGVGFIKSSTAPSRLLTEQSALIASAAIKTAATTAAATASSSTGGAAAAAFAGRPPPWSLSSPLSSPSRERSSSLGAVGGTSITNNNTDNNLRSPCAFTRSSYSVAASAAAAAAAARQSGGGSAASVRKSSAIAWASSGTAKAMAAGSGAARGGVGVVVAAGAGGSKVVKQLLPSFVMKDPEIDELSKRLENTKKLPTIFNEVGRRLLGVEGANWQRQAKQATLNLINLRRRFHPLTCKHTLLMTTALFTNMLLQLWMYYTGRLNLYLLMGVLAQFSNKLFKRWGKALLMGIKEARRSRNCRLALAQSDAPPVTLARTPAFAPPGAIPVVPASITTPPSPTLSSIRSIARLSSSVSPVRSRPLSLNSGRTRSPVARRRILGEGATRGVRGRSTRGALRNGDEGGGLGMAGLAEGEVATVVKLDESPKRSAFLKTTAGPGSSSAGSVRDGSTERNGEGQRGGHGVLPSSVGSSAWRRLGVPLWGNKRGIGGSSDVMRSTRYTVEHNKVVYEDSSSSSPSSGISDTSLATITAAAVATEKPKNTTGNENDDPDGDDDKKRVDTSRAGAASAGAPEVAPVAPRQPTADQGVVSRRAKYFPTAGDSVLDVGRARPTGDSVIAAVGGGAKKPSGRTGKRRSLGITVDDDHVEREHVPLPPSRHGGGDNNGSEERYPKRPRSSRVRGSRSVRVALRRIRWGRVFFALAVVCGMVAMLVGALMSRYGGRRRCAVLFYC